MKFFQLTVTTILKKNVHFSMSSELIGNNINKAMLKDEELMKYHEQKVYKYVFDNFYPVEKEGIYQEKRIYVFNIRSFNERFILKVRQCLTEFESQDIKVIAIGLKTIYKKQINYIQTVTPAIITVESKPWLLTDDISLLVKRLQANLEKKYKFFFNEEIGEIEDYFIEKLKILNKKPMFYNYKTIKLLSHKFYIKVNDDEKSQKLAFIALGAGLSEKNSSLGAGFCKCDWR